VAGVSGNITWYIDRGAGIVALALLTASVVLGIVSAVRVRSPRWPRFALADLHRNIALLALSFGAVHAGASVVDSYVSISPADALVPFVSSYKPLWVGVGAIAADLMLAVLLTSALRRRIGYRRWRAVHYLSYGCWLAAVAHSIAIGSDLAVTAVLVVFAACFGAMAAGLTLRLGGMQTAQRR
jgi:DMSO/TMAO reductase YedYZ heme-binding membrane subunit